MILLAELNDRDRDSTKILQLKKAIEDMLRDDPSNKGKRSLCGAMPACPDLLLLLVVCCVLLQVLCLVNGHQCLV